ncbi:MAG: response regulator [Planctomycetota bacterium]|jgi:putative nucleotidyltransferase with HDIG domain
MDEKKRILFIDDDRSVLDGLRRMMHKMRDEWKMEYVTTAGDALKVMRSTHYDIVVSDLRMPSMDGVEFFEKVKKKYPDVLRFMLSGYLQQPLQGRAAKCVHQFIPKPCDAEQLKKMIARSFALRDRLRSEEASEIVSNLHSLPVMPKAYQDVISVLSDPQCSPRNVGKMIGQDIGMSAKILQVVNATFRSRAGRIVDPVHAVVWLGLKTIEALILTDGVFLKLTEKQVKDFHAIALQEHCARVGLLAKAICRTMNMSDDDLDVAAMAGILHDAGKIILIAKFPEKYAEAIRVSRDRRIPLYDAELELLNVTHAQLGGCLLELWGIPNPIIEAAAFHHDPGLCISDEFSIISAVYIADAIDHMLCCGLSDGWCEEIDMDYLQQFDLAEKWSKWCSMHLPFETVEDQYVG